MIALSVLAHPVALYFAITAVLAITLMINWKLRKVIRDLQAAAAQSAINLTDSQAEVQRYVGLLRADLEQALSEFRLAASSNAAPKSMININRRSQALRLHRAGETPEKISQALGMSRGEVDLLLKVQGIVLESFNNPVPAAINL